MTGQVNRKGRGKAVNKKRLRELWSVDGLPLAIMAIVLRHNKDYIRRAAHRLDLPRQSVKRGRPMLQVLDEDASLLKSLWLGGVRVVDIAAIFGVSQGQVTRLVKRSELPRRREAYVPRKSAV